MKDYIISLFDIIIEIGLLFLLIFMPFAYGSVEFWTQATFELCALIIFIVWIAKICIEGNFTIRRNILDIPILVFFCLAIVSRISSIDPHISQLALHRLIAYVLLYYIVVHNFFSFSRLNRLSLYIITLGGVVSLVGIAGYFNKNALSSLWPYATFATFTTTSHFAGYIGTVFPLSLALLFAAQGSKKIYFAFSSIVIAAAAIFCQDKGGWIQFIGATLFFITASMYSGFLKKRGYVLLLIGILFIWALSFYGFQPIIQRLAPVFTLNFESSPEATIYSRWIYWKDTLKMIMAHPLFGTGIGTFSVAYPQFRSPEAAIFLNYAHQDFLQLASEMGLVGLAVFGWILFSLFKSGLGLIINNLSSLKKALISGSLAGIFGLLVHSLYDFNLHIPSNVVIFIVLFALVSALFKLAHLESKEKDIFWINFRLNLLLRTCIFLAAVFSVLLLAISIIKPYQARICYEKAQSFQENIEWDKAIDEYNKAKELDPRDSAYYYALANIYAVRAGFDFLDKDRYIELAIKNYNKAIRLNPYHGDYYLALGRLYNLIGDKEFASKNLTKALSLDPNNKFYQETINLFHSQKPNS